MFVIGVTGGIGSGKSTVASMLSDWGIPVIDADHVSRQVTDTGGVALPELVEQFGGRIIASDGSLNREKMADLVFKDHKKRDLINRIIHAHVMREIGRQIDALTAKKVKAVALDVPIPVKEGFLDRAHYIIAVTAPDDLRIHRLVLRGMSEGDARRRMAIQLTQDEYVALAHVQIANDGDRASLREKVRSAVLPELQKRGVPLNLDDPAS